MDPLDNDAVVDKLIALVLVTHKVVSFIVVEAALLPLLLPRRSSARVPMERGRCWAAVRWGSGTHFLSFVDQDQPKSQIQLG